MKELLVTNRRGVRESFSKSDQDVEKDIEIIREWFKTQPHLPEIPNDNMIELFLTMNKFSLEITKPKMDMYYTIRSLVPEIYKHTNPTLPHMKILADVMGTFTPLPKQTKDHCRVSVIKIMGNVEDFKPYQFFAYVASLMEVRMQYDVTVGDIYIFDDQHLKLGHLMNITPVHLKIGTTIMEKVFSNRIKSFHLVNYPPFVDVFLSICKGILKPKLMSRIHLHKNLEELYEYVPKEILPVEYGGDELPLNDLNDLWRKYLEQHLDRFNKLDEMKVNEDLRPTPLENDEILGYYGNFKKLDVD